MAIRNLTIWLETLVWGIFGLEKDEELVESHILLELRQRVHEAETSRLGCEDFKWNFLTREVIPGFVIRLVRDVQKHWELEWLRRIWRWACGSTKGSRRREESSSLGASAYLSPFVCFDSFRAEKRLIKRTLEYGDQSLSCLGDFYASYRRIAPKPHPGITARASFVHPLERSN